VSDRDEGNNKYIEIINWEKAQTRLEVSNDLYAKVYTSLLDYEPFERLPDADSQMLVIGLFLLQKRIGKGNLHADPAWLFRRISFLKKIPDLRPLFNAKDSAGNPKPFIRYFRPAVAGKGNDAAWADGDDRMTAAREQGNDPLYDKAAALINASQSASKRSLQKHFRISHARADKLMGQLVRGGIIESYKKAGRAYFRLCSCDAQKKAEHSKQSKASIAEQTPVKPLAYGKEEESKTLTGFTKEQREPEQSRAGRKANESQSKRQPQNPTNPTNSDAGQANKQMHIMPKTPARSAINRPPEQIGNIISGIFKPHWRDPDAEAFGWEIARALGLPRTAENADEWGSFASMWSRIKAVVVSDEKLCEIRCRAIQLAQQQRKRKGVRKPGAVWNNAMEGVLAKRGISLPPPQKDIHPIRASPKTAFAGEMES